MAKALPKNERNLILGLSIAIFFMCCSLSMMCRISGSGRDKKTYTSTFTQTTTSTNTPTASSTSTATRTATPTKRKTTATRTKTPTPTKTKTINPTSPPSYPSIIDPPEAATIPIPTSPSITDPPRAATIQIPTSPPVSFDCYRDWDCGDFGTRARMWEVLNYCNYNLAQDPWWLDGDNDGVPCETLP